MSRRFIISRAGLELNIFSRAITLSRAGSGGFLSRAGRGGFFSVASVFNCQVSVAPVWNCQYNVAPVKFESRRSRDFDPGYLDPRSLVEDESTLPSLEKLAMKNACFFKSGSQELSYS